jgi:hypothetical protein
MTTQNTGPTKPILEKSDFQEFTTRTHYNGTKMLLPRCQAYKTYSNKTIQCNRLASKNAGFTVCRTHGGTLNSGKRTDQGIANQLASVITHGQRCKATVEAKTKLFKNAQALSKIAQIVGIQPISQYANRSLTAADIPRLLDDIKI